jgi:UDP-glucose 4-epimerase
LRVAVTGIASDFASAIAPLLFDDPEVEEVVGIDLREPRVADRKLRFEREDVRSERLAGLFDGCEAAIHLAFVVDELRDKEKTHSVNIGGSQNVIETASRCGVSRLVIASSVASYGAHPDHPLPIDEDRFPRGNHDKYYFYDKAQVEHYIEWWLARNPDAEMTITRLRPAIVVGPAFAKPAMRRVFGPTSLVPAGVTNIQLVWETDLARAFVAAAKRPVPGAFNIASEDWIDFEEFAGLRGARLRRVPGRAAGVLADVAFRLRVSPFSSNWIIGGEPIVTPERAARELGWRPQFSTAEAARMRALQLGRPIMPGCSEGVFGRKGVAEETLRPTTERLRAWAASIPGLRAALPEGDELDRFAERVEHELMPYRDLTLHLEVHDAGDADAPTLVFSPGMGAYARTYLPLLGKLCDEGFNVVAIDRPGHGLSEGRRGDCTMDQILGVVEAAVRFARERFDGKVALLGSSLGGIIGWYALTREPDVDAVVSHNVASPRVLPNGASGLKARLVRSLATIAPHAPVPIEQIADFGQVSREPEILDYVGRRLDGIWCWTLSARFVDSLTSFVPQLEWSRVATPTLVLVGEHDGMVTADYTRRVLADGAPPDVDLRVLPGMAHMLFFDHLSDTLPVLTEWLRARLSLPVAV